MTIAIGPSLAADATTRAHCCATADLIARAASLAAPRRAIVLGCGRGGDIPIGPLLEKIRQVDFVDIDGKALGVTGAAARAARPGSLQPAFFVADLTGLIGPLRAAASAVTAKAEDEWPCLDDLGTLLTTATPIFWQPPHREHYSLVICSGVLMQLQASVRGPLEAGFLRRFPDGRRALATHPGWRTAIWSFARRIEEAWIDHLSTLAEPHGIVSLVDTVHVAWLQQDEYDAWTTEGAWIATRTARLADYLRAWELPIAEKRWPWLRPDAKGPGPATARLYGVQGLIYRTASHE